MANPARGEVVLRIGDSEHTLCLTLGALAEIEALPRDGQTLSAKTLIAILAALLRGGGSSLDVADLRTASLDLETAMAAVARCFEAAA
jgi:hypothetical protein